MADTNNCTVSSTAPIIIFQAIKAQTITVVASAFNPIVPYYGDLVAISSPTNIQFAGNQYDAAIYSLCSRAGSCFDYRSSC